MFFWEVALMPDALIRPFTFLRPAALVAAVLLALSPAQAAPVTIVHETFDSDPVTSPTQAPGTWYTDRYAPAGFERESFLGDNRLKLTLSESDGANNRPAGFAAPFYNTQGRKFDLLGATSIAIDFFVDAAFETVAGRIGGLWGTAVDALSVITMYPIIEFANGRFQFWDGAAFEVVNDTSFFQYGAFASLMIALDPDGDSANYFVNGTLIGSAGANGSTQFSNAIVQGINTTAGVNRTLYFDNLKATVDGPDVPPIPLPATLPLLLAAFGGLAVLRRRNR
jgi:hypothetical protein